MRIKRPDRKNALSIIEAAQRDMKFTLTVPINEDSSAMIIRNIYGSFRMVGDALLINKGIESEEHIMPIKEILKLNLKTNKSLILLTI